MLVSIGRVAARRVLAPAPFKLLVAAALHRRIVDLGARGIAVSALAQSPAAKGTVSSSIKAKSSAKAKAKSKAKSKATKSKATKKPKAPKPKATKTTASPKRLTPEQKQKHAILFLQRLALVKEMPKNPPKSAWNVFISRKITKASPLASSMAGLSSAFASLPDDAKRDLNNEAARNRHAHVEKLKAWVQEYPPEAIYVANLARRRLSRKLSKRFAKISDHRLPARPISSFFHYYIKRRGDGIIDSDHAGFGNVSRQVGSEWKSLAPSEKKKYDAMYQEDAERFQREFSTLKPKIKEYIKAQKQDFGRTTLAKSTKKTATGKVSI
ncbi:hypothetical protein CDD81_5480 [Ophiocordyceps australis]|uniref:HMG box domain-containing protein n=1 Tax=Ophiocordyceps australis TaxID=1399860 RepID=A0A2C5Y876_9HYPO|nr:hypothetical protein CDD81_5480 [Ophiocordyceps australis]